MMRQYVQCRLDTIETLFQDVLSKARKRKRDIPGQKSQS